MTKKTETAAIGQAPENRKCVNDSKKTINKIEIPKIEPTLLPPDPGIATGKIQTHTSFL